VLHLIIDSAFALSVRIWSWIERFDNFTNAKQKATQAGGFFQER